MPNTRIPLTTPNLAGREGEYLAQCIADNWVSSVGPFVNEFESVFAASLGAEHVVACASGTAALHLALIAAGVGPGDLVLVSDLTFIAPANAIRYVGAEPIFVDCDAVYGQIDADLVERYLVEACERRGGALVERASGKRVAALLPVHVLGHAAPILRLVELARAFDIALIEDAAEAVGVRVGDRAAGRFGLAGCVSFNGNKTLTAGAGGAVIANAPRVAETVRLLSQQAKAPGVEYVHEAIGYNYRMSNLHAALALAQLEQLDGFLARKRVIAERYRAAFDAVDGVSWIDGMPGAEAAWWLFTIRVDASKTGVDARQLMAQLAAAQIESRPLWQPLHCSPAHRGARALGGSVAERLFAEALSLPSSTSLNEAEQDRVIAVATTALDANTS